MGFADRYLSQRPLFSANKHKDGYVLLRNDAQITNAEANIRPRAAGAEKLCDVRSNLSGVQQDQLMKREKKGTCFTSGYLFYICKFEVRVIVAPADLRFELWFGGQKFSGNHDPLTVSWDQTGSGLHMS